MTSKFLHLACDKSQARQQRLEQDILLEASLYVYGRRQTQTDDLSRLAAAVDVRNVERARGARLHNAWVKARGLELLVRTPEARP